MNASPAATPRTAPRRPAAADVPAVDFYRVEARAARVFGRVVLDIVSPGGLIEATFFGEDKRPYADIIAAELNACRPQRRNS